MLGAAIYTSTSSQTGAHDSNHSPTEPASPENQTKPESDIESAEFPHLTELEPPTSASPGIDALVVPDDYPTIQQAVDCASDGATVFVKNGQYNETVTIDKSLLLLGEDKQSTIIDANSVGPDLMILHDNVNVTGFTLTNTMIPSEGNPWFPDFVPPIHLPDLRIVNASHCYIYRNKLIGSTIGVSVENSSQIVVTENEISHNTKGVELSFSTNSYITNNVVYGGTTGIVIASSTANNVVNNTITDAFSGVWLRSASGNNLRDNKLLNNFHNFAVTGSNVGLFVNDVAPSNTIDGRPIYYWIGESNKIVPSDAACIILVNCTDVTVQDYDLPLSSHGIILVNTNNSLIKSNTLASINPSQSEDFGEQALSILLFKSFNNVIEYNRANINLEYSSNNSMAQNTGLIRLYESDFNEIFKNNITSISFVSGDRSGIALENCSGNQIRENTISGNSVGVWLTQGSHNNSIVENNIFDNAQGGIQLMGDHEDWPPSGDKKSAPGFNLIFNNTITGNGNQGILDSAYCTRIVGNNLEKNRGWGILLSNSVNCSITGNVIEGFFFGGDGGVNTTNCIIIGNNITANSLYSQYGIWFLSEYPGTFYHNNFFVLIDVDGGVSHVWDNGNEGNYWYYWRLSWGTDSNGDGIVDTPYLIDDGNQDNYALMEAVNIDAYQSYPD